MEASIASLPHAAAIKPRPGLPGYPDDDFVDIRLLEPAHGVGDRTVRNWRNKDGLPFIKIGQQVLVRVGDYRGWLKSRKVTKGRKRRAA